MLRSARWRPPDGGAPLLLEVSRRDGEVVYRYRADVVLVAETVSPRPYRAGMILGDGTGAVCALALFCLFCRARGLDARRAAETAGCADRSRFEGGGCARLLSNAMAEGLAVPSTWNGRAIEGLAESLHDVGELELARFVARLAGVILSADGLAL